MCWKTECAGCGKATWSGCGKHITSALEGVPIADRCAGWETGKCPGKAASIVLPCGVCGLHLQAESAEEMVAVTNAHLECSPSCKPQEQQ